MDTHIFTPNLHMIIERNAGEHRLRVKGHQMNEIISSWTKYGDIAKVYDLEGRLYESYDEADDE